MQADKSLRSQIPHHPFADVTPRTCQLTGQARINNRLTQSVSDPEFTKSSLSPEHFESKPPSRVQANHHLSLLFLFLLTPVRMKDSSIIIGPEKVDYNSYLCRKWWSLSSSALKP